MVLDQDDISRPEGILLENFLIPRIPALAGLLAWYSYDSAAAWARRLPRLKPSLCSIPWNQDSNHDVPTLQATFWCSKKPSRPRCASKNVPSSVGPHLPLTSSSIGGGLGT